MRFLDGTAAARPSVFVEGEAGIGKTRLVAEFLEIARGRGVRALQGCCYQMQEAGPYFPFLQILSQVQAGGSWSEEQLGGLAGDTLGRSNWASLSEDARGRRAQFLRELTDAILREAATEETILCVEDVQWADLGSLLLLNNLVDIRRPGFLIVCTARTDEPVAAEVRQLVARIGQKSRRITLQGLSDTEVQGVVKSLAGPGWVTEEEARELRSFTRGNPLFLRELFLHLLETGLLQRHTVQESTRRTRTPDSIAHVIDLRLCSLPVRVRRALAVASVAGTDFSASLVAHANSETEVAAIEELEVGVARCILQVEDTLEGPRYRFTHPLLASRLYDSLTASERRDLHRRVAEAGSSGNLSLPASELARHHALGFGVAGGRKAVGYCRAAAEQAERVLAYEKAAHFWELALRCTRQRSRQTRAKLYRRLGWALWAASKWEQAGEVWAKAVSLFELLGDRKQEGELALALGDVHRWRGKLQESERWVERALSLPLASPTERGRALALLGGIRCFRDESGGLELLEEADDLIRSHGGDPTAAFWLSYGFLMGGESLRAHIVAKDGLEEAQRRGDSRAAVLLAVSLFNHELSQLRIDAARSYVGIVEGAAENDDPPALIRSLLCRSLLWGYTGRWDRVVRLCEQWMARVRLASSYQVATALLFWAEAKLALGDVSAARSAMVRALPDLEELQPVGAAHLARAHIRVGKDEEAASLVRRYSTILASSARPTAAAGQAVLGEVASSLNEPELWQRCYDLLKRQTRPLVMACSPVSVQRVSGRLAARLRLWAAAVEHFDTAVEQLAKGGARWELAQTYLDYAEMRRVRRRRGDARKAAALELEAKAIFRDLGIQQETLGRAAAPSTDGNRFALTERELEVLSLVAEGCRNQEIAEALTLSHRTVERHLENIFIKVDVKTRTEAVVLAVHEGLVGPLTRSSDGDGLAPERRQARTT